MTHDSPPPHTIAGLLDQGRGMKGICRNCGREKSFSFAALMALPLPRAETLGEAGTRLKCKDCGGRQIILAPADIDPQAPAKSASQPATEGAHT